MKKGLLTAGLAVLVLGAVAVLRAMQLEPHAALAQAVPRLELDADVLAGRLAEALRIPTVSQAIDVPIDRQVFADFHALLVAQFPRVHQHLQIERISEWSLLLRWPGSDAQRKPAMLLAHMDVVPVDPSTVANWQYPAFAGTVADGYIWGRGALDDKSNLIAQLEAIELLLAQGFVPQRSLYFGYGHDEEIGGQQGAKKIAATLAARGERLAYTLDEGSAITLGIVPGIAQPVASIMSGEKGYASYELRVVTEGGHSSTPKPDGAVVRLARALTRIDEHPLPAQLTPPVAAMLDRMAPHLPFAKRLVVANREVLEPVLLNALGQGAITAALTRTTQAMTQLDAGFKDNVLPTSARAVINFRLLPGQRIADLEQHLRVVIDDPGITLTLDAAFANEAPPLSDPAAPEFALIERTVNEVFPQALVSSGIVMATTDNRHYAGVADQRYGFAPFVYAPEDQARVHGINERISVEGYADMVRFYVQLLQNSGA
ncbi:MAG: M20 family peptidase [Pseudomonadota bacterium]|nr:M20 family peptidase [Pseudomonadota bacterium]